MTSTHPWRARLRFFAAVVLMAMLLAPVAAVAQAAGLPQDDVAELASAAVKAVGSGQWGVAAGLALLVAVWLIRHKKLPLTTWFPKLGTDRGGALLALILAVIGGVATTIATGGAVSVTTFISALGVAWTAAGGWNWMRSVVFPKDPPKPGPSEAPAVLEPSVARPGATVIVDADMPRGGRGDR